MTSVDARILDGLRVVELAAFVAAPLAGATLAGLGADVIRVEQLGGGVDAARWPVHEGRSLYRAGLDRGKRSLALDLRSEAGRNLVRELVCEAGVLVTNLPEQPWLEFARLREQRADMIVVRISGSRDGRAAVDYTVNAATGFPLVTGPEDASGPVNHVMPVWDVTTGALAASAVLAAELHRRATGEGQLVELALADVAVFVARQLGYLDEARLVDEPRPRIGNHIYGTFGRDFRTKDGRHLFVCAMTPRQWRGLCTATELETELGELEAAAGIDLAQEDARYEHRLRIAEAMAPWFAARTLDEAGAALEAAGALWGPYQTFKELAASAPEAEAFASPLSFGAFPRAAAERAPEIGADTAEILSELGLDDTALAELERDGVI